MPKDINKKNKEKKEKKHFFKDSKAELKKVIWPTPKQLVNSTIAVITIAIIVAIITFVLDLAFEKINTYGVDKLKALVGTESNTVTTNETIENEESSENTTNEVTENTIVNEAEANVTSNETMQNTENVE